MLSQRLINMSDRLTKEEINTEIESYKGMFREEMERIQVGNPDDYKPHPFGFGFVWGYVTVCVNEMTGITKRYKTLLGSVCSVDIYGLAEEACDTMNNIEFSHINMD